MDSLVAERSPAISAAPTHPPGLNTTASERQYYFYVTSFHPDAQAAFSSAAEDLLKEVKAYPHDRRTGQKLKFDIHPSAVIGPEDIIGPIQTVEREIDGTGVETGRFWMSGGYRVGWNGEAYQKLRNLAGRVAKTKELDQFMTIEFVLDEVFDWLRQTLEGHRSDSMTDFVSQRCEQEIRTHDI